MEICPELKHGNAVGKKLQRYRHRCAATGSRVFGGAAVTTQQGVREVSGSITAAMPSAITV
jgi:hypothetical protein